MKVTLIDHMGTDLSVVNAARVSFGKKSEYFDHNDEKLIKYLAKHEHTSPFGHCFASFHVKAPIFVARQLVKHKFLRWNEISRRYVDSEPEFYTPEVWRRRSEDKKQGSSNFVIEHLRMQGFGEQSVHDGNFKYQMHGVDLYRDMLEAGVCPEQARMVLPQSTFTEWYWSGSLDAFADMYNLRSKPDTQKETQTIAFQIGNEMRELYPFSWRALTGGV